MGRRLDNSRVVPGLRKQADALHMERGKLTRQLKVIRGKLASIDAALDALDASGDTILEAEVMGREGLQLEIDEKASERKRAREAKKGSQG